MRKYLLLTTCTFCLVSAEIWAQDVGTSPQLSISPTPSSVHGGISGQSTPSPKSPKAVASPARTQAERLIAEVEKEVTGKLGFLEKHLWNTKASEKKEFLERVLTKALERTVDDDTRHAVLALLSERLPKAKSPKSATPASPSYDSTHDALVGELRALQTSVRSTNAPLLRGSAGDAIASNLHSALRSVETVKVKEAQTQAAAAHVPAARVVSPVVQAKNSAQQQAAALLHGVAKHWGGREEDTRTGYAFWKYRGFYDEALQKAAGIEDHLVRAEYTSQLSSLKEQAARANGPHVLYEWGTFRSYPSPAEAAQAVEQHLVEAHAEAYQRAAPHVRALVDETTHATGEVIAPRETYKASEKTVAGDPRVDEFRQNFQALHTLLTENHTAHGGDTSSPEFALLTTMNYLRNQNWKKDDNIVVKQSEALGLLQQKLAAAQGGWAAQTGGHISALLRDIPVIQNVVATYKERKAVREEALHIGELFAPHEEALRSSPTLLQQHHDEVARQVVDAIMQASENQGVLFNAQSYQANYEKALEALREKSATENAPDILKFGLAHLQETAANASLWHQRKSTESLLSTALHDAHVSSVPVVEAHVHTPAEAVLVSAVEHRHPDPQARAHEIVDAVLGQEQNKYYSSSYEKLIKQLETEQNPSVKAEAYRQMQAYHKKAMAEPVKSSAEPGKLYGDSSVLTWVEASATAQGRIKNLLSREAVERLEAEETRHQAALDHARAQSLAALSQSHNQAHEEVAHLGAVVASMQRHIAENHKTNQDAQEQMKAILEQHEAVRLAMQQHHNANSVMTAQQAQEHLAHLEELEKLAGHLPDDHGEGGHKTQLVAQIGTTKAKLQDLHVVAANHEENHVVLADGAVHLRAPDVAVSAIALHTVEEHVAQQQTPHLAAAHPVEEHVPVQHQVPVHGPVVHQSPTQQH